LTNRKVVELLASLEPCDQPARPRATQARSRASLTRYADFGTKATLDSTSCQCPSNPKFASDCVASCGELRNRDTSRESNSAQEGEWSDELSSGTVVPRVSSSGGIGMQSHRRAYTSLVEVHHLRQTPGHDRYNMPVLRQSGLPLRSTVNPISSCGGTVS
jgi:hypothetical protein